MRRLDERAHLRPRRYRFDSRSEHGGRRAIESRILAEGEVLLREHRPLHHQELAEVGQRQQPVLHLVMIGIGHEREHRAHFLFHQFALRFGCDEHQATVPPLREVGAEGAQ